MAAGFSMEVDWSKMDLAKDELTGLVIDHDWIQTSSKFGNLSIFAKIFSEKSIPLIAIITDMKSTWKITNNLEVIEVGDHNLIIFTFESSSDKEKVLNGGLWSFDRCLLLVHDYDGSLRPREIQFSSVDFWVQVHDLPLDLMNSKVGLAIGNLVGQAIEVDAQKNSMAWGKFLRVKVRVDIDKPLKRGTTLNILNQGRIWVYFRYEKLPNFFYKCGSILHIETECESEDVKVMYGAWMRANSNVAILGRARMEDDDVDDDDDVDV